METVVKTIVVKRVARMPHMNIITMEPSKKRTIPVYTKGIAERDRLLKDYYNYCDQSDIYLDSKSL